MANKMTNLSDVEKRFIVALVKGDVKTLREIRGTDMLAGTQSITYTPGTSGGFLVPQEFEADIIQGMAQFDPLLDKRLVNLLTTKTGRPLTYPGWDLSTIAATLVAEGVQQNPGSVPATLGIALGAYTFRASLDASIELEDDDFEPVVNQMKRAFSIALARGIGAYLATGSGSGQPQGVLTGAANSGITLDPTITSDVSGTLNDQFQEAYFSLNRYYRASEKCAWVMSDSTYKWIRKLTDKQGRPLLDIRKDKEEIMGKPVLISPTMPTYGGSPIVSGKIVFGDLSHYVVRATQMTLTRTTQAAGYIDYGKALYTARMRVDAKISDPTSGASAPIVYITVHP